MGKAFIVGVSLSAAGLAQAAVVGTLQPLSTSTRLSQSTAVSATPGLTGATQETNNEVNIATGAPISGTVVEAQQAALPAPGFNADMNRDGFFTTTDVVGFQQLFEQGAAGANCDGSTVHPVVNVADFTCFLQHFAQGQAQVSFAGMTIRLPDCNGDGFCTQADFEVFQQLYRAGDPRANCDGSTQEPVVNAADFTCFLRMFAQLQAGRPGNGLPLTTASPAASPSN